MYLQANAVHGVDGTKRLIEIIGIDQIAHSAKTTSAGMPGLSLSWGSVTVSLMAYTVEERPSAVCTLRGVNSAWSAMCVTCALNVSPGNESTFTLAACPRWICP